MHRPGLALTEFVEKFSWERIQIIGETEWTYLETIGAEARRKVFAKYFNFELPCIILSKKMQPHQEMLEFAEGKQVPVLGTSMMTVEIMDVLSAYLADYFAVRISLHATFVDVYGVGMLYTGRSGIGKSECALDLVERGHRLVADDIVNIMHKNDILIGSGNKLLGHHMEIRGIGIIDVQKLFGIKAVRSTKKVEIEVELVDWAADIDYDRIGIDEQTTEILDVPIQKVVVPVSPGKNITVISEVIAMNTLLKISGINPAKEFNEKLIQAMQKIKAERKP